MPVFLRGDYRKTGSDSYILCILIAAELFMSFSFLGYIHIEPISMTFVYIPVLVAGCVLGPKEGTLVGTIFGLASMWKASAFYIGDGDTIFSPVRSGRPVESILLSVGARALFGLIAGLFYKAAKKSKYPKAGILLVSSIGRPIHTFCVYLFMGIFFSEMGYTVSDTLKGASRPDYLVFMIIVDAIVLGCYIFCRSAYMKRLMYRARAVDKLNAVVGENKWKIAALLIAVMISSISVAVYFTNRISSVMEYYGITLSAEISYDLMHLQIQFLLGMISLAVIAIIFILLYQKNSNYLYHEARMDGLTGLFRRRIFFQKGEKILGRLKYNASDRGGYFLILDIDHFKEINDKYGHPTGDKVLKEIARILENNLGEKGIIGRLGGDEFVGLINVPSSKKEIIQILNNMKKEISKIQAGEEYVTCSMGVVLIEKNQTIDQLYRSADRLLYEAKKNGKNQIAFGQGSL